MGIIDFILNLACVLLWFNWQSARLAQAAPSSPVSLLATLKRAEPRPNRGWLSLSFLLVVLALRSLFYWNAGAAWNWTARLNLGVITLSFRSDHLTRMLLFSALSFLLVLGTLYAWLLLLSLVNHRLPADDPIQRLVRLHLGWVERWAALFKVALPFLAAALAWILGSPVLARFGIVPPPLGLARLVQEGLLLGLASYLLWKPILLAICGLYLLNSYVYLGKSKLWRFLNSTGSNLLKPLRFLPVRLGKLDFSPLLAIGLILVLSHWLARWLPRLFQRVPF